MTPRKTLSIGPELPEFGSWTWLGHWMIEALSPVFDVTTFSDPGQPPKSDILIFLKFKPPAAQLDRLRKTSRLIFVPVDVYGSAREIDSDTESIRCMSLVILHSQRLSRYFQGITHHVFMDHPLKYILPEIRMELVEGPLLWIGKKCNLQAAIPYLKTISRWHRVRVLTDMGGSVFRAEELGLDSNNLEVGEWSPQRHIEWLATAKAAIDVKGDDFRSRQKPPAKALDFLASGVPVITNRGSSVDLSLTPRGFSLLDAATWLEEISVKHQQSISQQAMAAREQLTAEVCAAHLVHLVCTLVERSR